MGRLPRVTCHRCWTGGVAPAGGAWPGAGRPEALVCGPRRRPQRAFPAEGCPGPLGSVTGVGPARARVALQEGWAGLSWAWGEVRRSVPWAQPASLALVVSEPLLAAQGGGCGAAGLCVLGRPPVGEGRSKLLAEPHRLQASGEASVWPRAGSGFVESWACRWSPRGGEPEEWGKPDAALRPPARELHGPAVWLAQWLLLLPGPVPPHGQLARAGLAMAACASWWVEGLGGLRVPWLPLEAGQGWREPQAVQLWLPERQVSQLRLFPWKAVARGRVCVGLSSWAWEGGHEGLNGDP